MNRLRTILHTAKFLALTAACWLAVHAGSLALAGEEPEVLKQGVKGSKWVVSYGLVILAMGLGLAVILHASHRRDRAKPEAYEGDADATDEE